jgi:hypothetical protein
MLPSLQSLAQPNRLHSHAPHVDFYDPYKGALAHPAAFDRVSEGLSRTEIGFPTSNPRASQLEAKRPRSSFLLRARGRLLLLPEASRSLTGSSKQLSLVGCGRVVLGVLVS